MGGAVRGQRERLVELGVRPPEKPAVEAKGRPRAGAFERGLAALAQYVERERTVVAGR
ncbi:hypothetical protein [Streptomyces sp. NPDC091649]|uniref:hypothetical protein n=1 Tax=Streptomyces sp. NPDC091649 TaxID=3366004 RepID=UPI0037F693FF